MSRPVRIDSFLWAVRIFKTRSIAQDACRKGRVAINDVTAKPAKMVMAGDIVSVRKPPVTLSFKVLQTTTNRMGAKLVPEYILNVTPPEQYELLEMKRMSGYVDRAQGLGRPTKRERRDLEQFLQAPVIDEPLLEEWDEETLDDDEEQDNPSSDLLDWDNW
ncbi:RNA-binding S4 domain-containing protein [Porphyromonas asaccharolytica]